MLRLEFFFFEFDGNDRLQTPMKKEQVYFKIGVAGLDQKLYGNILKVNFLKITPSKGHEKGTRSIGFNCDNAGFGLLTRIWCRWAKLAPLSHFLSFGQLA